MELLRNYLNRWVEFARKSKEKDFQILSPHLWIPAQFGMEHDFNDAPPILMSNPNWTAFMATYPFMLLTEAASWKIMIHAGDFPPSEDIFNTVKNAIKKSNVFKKIESMKPHSTLEVAFLNNCLCILFPEDFGLEELWWADGYLLSKEMNLRQQEYLYFASART